MVSKREATRLENAKGELQANIDGLSSSVHRGVMSTREFTEKAMPMKREIHGINIKLGIEVDNADHKNMPEKEP